MQLFMIKYTHDLGAGDIIVHPHHHVWEHIIGRRVINHGVRRIVVVAAAQQQQAHFETT